MTTTSNELAATRPWTRRVDRVVNTLAQHTPIPAVTMGLLFVTLHAATWRAFQRTSTSTKAKLLDRARLAQGLRKLVRGVRGVRGVQ